MNRRHFIKNSVAATSAVALMPVLHSLAADASQEVSISVLEMDAAAQGSGERILSFAPNAACFQIKDMREFWRDYPFPPYESGGKYSSPMVAWEHMAQSPFSDKLTPSEFRHQLSQLERHMAEQLNRCLEGRFTGVSPVEPTCTRGRCEPPIHQLSGLETFSETRLSPYAPLTKEIAFLNCETHARKASTLAELRDMGFKREVSPETAVNMGKQYLWSYWKVGFLIPS